MQETLTDLAFAFYPRLPFELGMLIARHTLEVRRRCHGCGAALLVEDVPRTVFFAHQPTYYTRGGGGRLLALRTGVLASPTLDILEPAAEKSDPPPLLVDLPPMWSWALVVPPETPGCVRVDNDDAASSSCYYHNRARRLCQAQWFVVIDGERALCRVCFAQHRSDRRWWDRWRRRTISG